MNTEIVCKDVEVEFQLFDSISRSLRAKLARKGGIERSFKALDGVSVEINQGERVGLIGQNGAGKSTFLRALAGIYPPQRGRISVVSPITSIFQIGVGMDVDASGYENIPLLMASSDIPKSNLEAVTKDVEEFSELGDALYRPIRTYSAGMQLRIGFAIATYQTQGVLLLDEVVGVGDQNFRTKSNARIQKTIDNAGTLVLASHANPLLQQHCDRGLVFSQGKIAFDGPIDEAIAVYEESKKQPVSATNA